jgi:Ca-activated chloride channel family protein
MAAALSWTGALLGSHLLFLLVVVLGCYRRERGRGVMRVAVTTTALLMTSIACLAQTVPEAPTTLRVSAKVVAVSAVVKAKDGTALTSLTKDDFTLKQDGKEQPIRYFSRGDDLPLNIVLMVDVSRSQRTLIGDEAIASDVFLRTMMRRPQDQAAFVQFDAEVTELQGMTSDPNRMHLIISALGMRKETAGATLLHDGVFAVTDRLLSKVHGRKAVILLTDGVDVGSRHSLKEAIEEAQRENVQVYSIFYSAWSGFSAPTGAPLPSTDGRETLKRFSERTGGRAFEVSPSLGLQAIFTRIAEDLSTQYELDYTPPSDTVAGRMHKLEVRAKHKGAIVQARDAFYAET